MNRTHRVNNTHPFRFLAVELRIVFRRMEIESNPNWKSHQYTQITPGIDTFICRIAGCLSALSLYMILDGNNRRRFGFNKN